ncbi:hypothetical protein HDR60_03310 [bacterium]|nr:hypothetical protein [bacterium]
MILAKNTSIYIDTLKKCLAKPCEENSHGISHELLGKKIVFRPFHHIDGTSEEYVNNELKWYDSKDLCIKCHKGIATNKVWQSCATDDGFVNSNYGWCIYSKENYGQFYECVNAIVNDLMTKQACMYYTRPSIHKEHNDGVHAKRDMICTCYTSSLLRFGKLEHHVHMRSNDIWYGLRNDLAWQQEVQVRLIEALHVRDIRCSAGSIVWFADSLHLYKRNYDNVMKFLEKYNERVRPSD